MPMESNKPPFHFKDWERPSTPTENGKPAFYFELGDRVKLTKTPPPDKHEPVLCEKCKKELDAAD